MSISCQLSHPQQVCSGDKWPPYDEKWTYNRCVVENYVHFLANLANYDRCVLAANGHIMNRNEPTIGVWWKYMSISDQISYLQ